MCLHYSKGTTGLLKDAIRNGTAKFYKYYEVVGSGDEKRAIAPYQRNKIEVGNDGIIQSNRKVATITQVEEEYSTIHQGIHVVCSLNRDFDIGEYITLTVQVEVEDLVGCDAQMSEAVFMKIKIDPDELKRRVANAIPGEDEDDDLEDDDDFDDEDDYDDEEDEDDYDDEDDDEDEFDDDDDDEWDDDDDDDDFEDD